MTQTRTVQSLALALVTKASGQRLKVASAESCTGGMIGAAITDISGSSAVFERGFVTYSNEAKSELLGVAPDIIARHGAVSGETAAAMALGALAQSHADIAISVTGIAGPGGGGSDKPVGLVWFGLAQTGKAVRVERRLFSRGSRNYVRVKAAETGLRMLLRAVSA